MSTSPPPDQPLEPTARSVRIDGGSLVVSLVDGRTLTVPTSWFPKLASATPMLLNRWRLIASGQGIHWPELDEDLSVAALLKGNRPR